MNTRLKKADGILIVFILFIAAAIFIWYDAGREQGQEVVVQVSGKEVARFPLKEDRTYTIKGKDGGSNYMLIKDGKVRVDDASCPDLLCKKQGAISQVGQSIICLPNQVVIAIQGEGAKTDAMAG